MDRGQSPLFLSRECEIRYSHLLAIRNGSSKQWSNDFVTRHRACLIPNHWQFGDDGQLYDGTKPIGAYRFTPVNDALQDFGCEPWWNIDPPISCIESVVGFLNWEWWNWHAEGRKLFALAALTAGLGYIVRIRDGEVFPGLIETEFPLGDIENKHGFYDGDFFIEGEGYSRYVRATIAKALADLELTPNWIDFDSNHNPHRVSSLTSANSQNETLCRDRFDTQDKELRLKLWGLNSAQKISRSRLMTVLED